MKKKEGKFIISLDLELMWGVRDVATKFTYGNNILGVHTALPKILKTFTKYNVGATFAIVGLLYFDSKEELLEGLPKQIPQYKHSNLSPYISYIDNEVGKNSKEDPYHFAPHLIKLIKETPLQEIATHTFSHFYSMEEGQTENDFYEDLKVAIELAKSRDIVIKSIVFPRNQVNNRYLEICESFGIIAYRSSEFSWIYSSRSLENERLTRRFFRLADSYFNISGHHCYSDDVTSSKNGIVNIPSSRFLRPYSSYLWMFEKLRLNRIKNSMTYAAVNGLAYHLWWHPHNFGINQEKNMSFLEEILSHYTKLNQQYGFQNYTMSELANKILKKEKVYNG